MIYDLVIQPVLVTLAVVGIVIAAIASMCAIMGLFDGWRKRR